jgi:hypothetical protein
VGLNTAKILGELVFGALQFGIAGCANGFMQPEEREATAEGIGGGSFSDCKMVEVGYLHGRRMMRVLGADKLVFGQGLRDSDIWKPVLPATRGLKPGC